MSRHDEPARPSSDACADERWQRVWSHRERLLKVARRRSVNVEDAEDAVHEAMVRATERRDVDESRLGAWLTSVTIRLCIDRFRQVGREAEAHARSVRAIPAQPTVDEPVCDRAEAKWLADRSRDLPDRQEQVLGLRAQGLDLAQIAQQTGLSYQAARSLLARARRTLLATLAGTLSVAVWLWRGRPWAAGGGAPTATLASAVVTLAIAGLALTTPFQAEADPDDAPQLRPYETPLPAEPSRASQKRMSPAPTLAGLPAEPGYDPTIPAAAGSALSSQSQGHPPASQDRPQSAFPELPQTPDPALPDAPKVSVVTPPVIPRTQPASVHPLDLGSGCVGVACALLTSEALPLPH